MKREVEIWHGRDHNGTRTMLVRVNDDGSVVIEGQDLGAAVAFFGDGLKEYEWAWEMTPDQIPRAVTVLGGMPGDDLVGTLRLSALKTKGEDPGTALRRAGVELKFWSRVGS